MAQVQLSEGMERIMRVAAIAGFAGGKYMGEAERAHFDAWALAEKNNFNAWKLTGKLKGEKYKPLKFEPLFDIAVMIAAAQDMAIGLLSVVKEAAQEIGE